MSSKNSLQNLIDHAAEIGVKLNAYVRGKNLHLEIIERTTAAKGQGADVMRRLCAMADQYGLAIRLYVFSYDPKLEAYYESFGFETDPDKGDEAYMCRYPKRLHETQMVDEIQSIRSGDSMTAEQIIKDVRFGSPKFRFLGHYGDVMVHADVSGKKMDILLRKNKQDIGGALMYYEGEVDGWYVNQIAIVDSERFNGYGLGFYKFMLGKGYTLISGGMQTPNGQAVWRKLMSDSTIKVSPVKIRDDDSSSIFHHDMEVDNPWKDNAILLVAKLNESVMVDEIKALSGPYKKENGWDEKVQKKTNGEMGNDEKVGEIDGIDVVKYGSEDDGQLIFVLQDGEKRVGYLELELRTYAQEEDEPFDGWFCETGLNSDYVGRGIGYRLYELVISLGYVLVSGHEQTGGSQSIWKKLMVNPRVRVRAIMFGEYTRLVPVNTVNPWSDNVLLMASKKRSVRESVMIDEIEVKSGKFELGMERLVKDFESGTPQKVGNLGRVEVYKSIGVRYRPILGERTYFALKLAGEIIGIVSLSEKYPYWQAFPHIEKKYRGSQLGTEIYKFILDQGYEICSEGTQTVGGQKIWQNIIKDPKYKIYISDDINGRRVLKSGENPWNGDKNIKLIASINESVQPMTETNIRNGIRYVVGVPLKVFGKIDDIIVSMGQKDDEWMFLFSIGGDKREAIGYASATMKKIHIDKKTFNVLNITDLGLYRKYRRKGIGFAFYNMLLEDGYVLISDETQTGDGEGLWRKLMKQPGIGVTTVKATKSEDKFEHIDLVADDPWAMKNVRIILQAGNQEITEGTPRVAVIQPQPKGLSRCTAVTCNALLSHFKKPLIDNAATVPRTAKGCFDLLQRRRLKVQPDITAPQKKVTVKVFANTHQNGAWFIGTPHHAMALIDGELFDSYGKGLDSRLILVVARIVS